MKAYLLGLIGYPLEHSFSKAYFTEKFERENQPHISYQNFPIKDIILLPEIIKSHPELIGFNVTHPHKKAILPYLANLDPLAQKVGAVNTVVVKNNQLIGYNSDVYGFTHSLTNVLRHTKSNKQNRALILGTGGSSEAVKVGLTTLDIPFQFVSRTERASIISYQDLHKIGLEYFTIIINTTPLGMVPDLDSFPDIPYHELTQKHLLFDLVYNPAETTFLRKGKKQLATCVNGREMLRLQAEASLSIWKKAHPVVLKDVTSI